MMRRRGEGDGGIMKRRHTSAGPGGVSSHVSSDLYMFISAKNMNPCVATFIQRLLCTSDAVVCSRNNLTIMSIHSLILLGEKHIHPERTKKSHQAAMALLRRVWRMLRVLPYCLGHGPLGRWEPHGVRFHTKQRVTAMIFILDWLSHIKGSPSVTQP